MSRAGARRDGRLVSGLLLFAWALAAGPATGAEVLRLEVERWEGLYRVSLDARLAAAPETVRTMVLEPAGWRRYVPWLVRVEPLGAPRPGVRRVRTVLRGCVLFFCRDLEHVQDFTARAHGRTVVAYTVPGMGDFRRGLTRWEILPARGGGTRMRMVSELEPAFWVPPVIGPWILKLRLREMALTVVRRMDGERAGEYRWGDEAP